MHPYMVDGDKAHVMKLDKPEVGKVYLFDSSCSNGLVAHRLVNKTPTCATLKGDHTAVSEIMPFSQLVGEIDYFEPKEDKGFIYVNRYPVANMVICFLSIKVGEGCLSDRNRHIISSIFHKSSCWAIDYLGSLLRSRKSSQFK